MSYTEVRIITLWQPWASLVALGLKKFETRSWATKYRGKLAIHAAKRPLDKDAERAWMRICELVPESMWVGFPLMHQLPLGQIVSVSDLTNCLQMTNLPAVGQQAQISLNKTCSGLSNLEIACGDWQPGRFAWKLENTMALQAPIPYTGGQGLRILPVDIGMQILEKVAP